jgi:hypothetical protein
VTTISVARDGHELGDFNFDGLQEGLASGYFRPDDWAWYEGLPEWLPLSEIVSRLRSQPLPQVPQVSPPPFVGPPKFDTQVIAPAPKSPRKKQDLSPRKGEVTYVLKQPKAKKSTKQPRIVSDWRNDPATEKQISFLSHLNAGPLPSNLTKGQAHDMIDARVSGHAFLSPKQMACLSYHGFDPSSLDFNEAKALLDRIHEDPRSFKVPEPWETAKYHLYPNLYPAQTAAASKGCAPLIVAAIFCLGVLVIMAIRLHLALR